MKKGIELHFLSGVYYGGLEGPRGYKGWRVAKGQHPKAPNSLQSKKLIKVGGWLMAISEWQHPSLIASKLYSLTIRYLEIVCTIT
jgi:hypothetical protein